MVNVSTTRSRNPPDHTKEAARRVGRSGGLPHGRRSIIVIPGRLQRRQHARLGARRSRAQSIVH